MFFSIILPILILLVLNGVPTLKDFEGFGTATALVNDVLIIMNCYLIWDISNTKKAETNSETAMNFNLCSLNLKLPIFIANMKSFGHLKKQKLTFKFTTI